MSCCFACTTDERLLEYDVDHVVADVQSQFQNIQILHTINFGNLLVLDHLQSIKNRRNVTCRQNTDYLNFLYL